MAVLQYDRPWLLRSLGLDGEFPFTGDVYKLRSLQLDCESTLRVHSVHAPFLRCSASNLCCKGATLFRANRTTVAVPCLSTDLVDGAKACKHCMQLWAISDDDGWYKLDKKLIPAAFAQ